MNSPQLLLEQAADQLPSPNGVAMAIMKMWQDDNTTVKQLAKLVQTDPALSGRLLKLANSAALSGRRAVVSIPEAVVRVGMQAVSQLAVAFSLIDQTSEGQCKAFKYERFWSQSLLMAIVGRRIALDTRVTTADDLFASCLLSRVGLLAFATIYPGEYSALLEDESTSLVEREQHQFGFDHNALSYEMMLNYGVPNALAEPSRYHESPDQSTYESGSRSARLVDAFHLAWQLSEIGMSPESAGSGQPKQLRSIAERLGLGQQKLSLTFDRAIADWHEWSKLLDLPDHDVPPLERLENGDDAETDAGKEFAHLRAVVVGNDIHSRAIFEHLAASQFETRQIAEGSSLARMAVEFQPGLIVLGADCDLAACQQLCRMIRSIEWGKALYLLAQREHLSQNESAELYRAGIDMVISSDISLEELTGRLATVERHLGVLNSWQHDRLELRRTATELSVNQRKFELLSLTDQLTEIPNRRAGMQALTQAWSRHRRNGSPLSLVMIDIDHFKSINDKYGHAAGDQALIAFANLLNQSVREDETVCRLGGEEFLLISSTADLKELVILSERLRTATEALEINIQNEQIKLSASFGLALSSDDETGVDALLLEADRALYQAKERGRNCIVCRMGGEFKTIRRS